MRVDVRELLFYAVGVLEEGRLTESGRYLWNVFLARRYRYITSLACIVVLLILPPFLKLRMLGEIYI